LPTLTITGGEPDDDEVVAVVLALHAIASRATAARPSPTHHTPRHKPAARKTAFVNPRSWTTAT
jgi:hypothetical protein